MVTHLQLTYALLDNNLKKIELYIHDDLSKSIAKKIETYKKREHTL